MLRSPRFRRRFLWLALLATVGGTATAAAVFWSNTADRLPDTPVESGGSVAPARPERQVPLTADRKTEALETATRFIRTAVAREHVESSWSLVHPALRQGLTRRQWSAGEIPIVPYPVDGARWRLGYSTAEAVGFEVLLMPRPGSEVRSMVFDIELKPVGSGARQRWLVSSWSPRASGLDQEPPASPERAAAEQRALEEREDLSLPAAWILVPIGLLAGSVLAIPVVLIGRDWRRRRIGERRHREFLAAREAARKDL